MNGDYTEILLALLAVSFTAWAGVVGWIGKGVLDRVDDIKDSVKELDQELQHWIIQTESRITAVETKLENTP